jgi:hypothetical protein
VQEDEKTMENTSIEHNMAKANLGTWAWFADLPRTPALSLNETVKSVDPLLLGTNLAEVVSTDKR